MNTSRINIVSGYDPAVLSGAGTVCAKGDKGNTGENGDSQVLNIVDSAAEGMVTITLNDDANTQYTIRKASAAFKLGVTPKIIITTSVSGEAIMQLAGSGTATINWDDGSNPETVTLTETATGIPHSYSDGASAHSIAIYGQDIMVIVCAGIGVSSIDVSRNTALTSIDMSKNTALTSLNCGYNQFTKAGLDTLFGTLHNNDIDGGKTIYRAIPAPQPAIQPLTPTRAGQ